jgi:hypothetical protein
MADVFVPSTLEQYNELRAAIFSGAQTVAYTHPGGAKTVTYRSLDDMLRILRLLAAELGLGGTTTPRQSYAQFSKGIRSGPSDCHFNRDCRDCP